MIEADIAILLQYPMDTKAVLSKRKFRLGLAVIVSITVALLPVYIAAILKLILWLVG